MHHWHDVALGSQVPDFVPVIIEIPRGSKVKAVHADDPEYVRFNLIHDLPPHRTQELRPFFEDYKALEHKTVIVDDFLDRDEAHVVIRDTVDLYSKHRDALRAGGRP